MRGVILSFHGQSAFLSNFHPAKIRFEGIGFPSVEHAYQAAKTLDLTKRREIAILTTPGKAKRAGNALHLRSDWEEVKVKIMMDLVYAKFANNYELKKKLLATDELLLVEGNYWHDNFWGVCYCQKCPKIGKNMLGRILMHVRERLST